MRPSAIAFFLAELLLFANVIVWPMAGHSLWASVAWAFGMVFTWKAYKWLNS